MEHHTQDIRFRGQNRTHNLKNVKQVIWSEIFQIFLRLRVHVEWIVLITWINIISFIFAVTPSSEMSKPTAASVLLMAFILVSSSGYVKPFMAAILLFI